MIFRKAKVKDAVEIYNLLDNESKKGKVLKRSLNEIYEKIRNFWICEKDGQVIGICSLEIIGWQDLGEIRSLVVNSKYRNKRIGEKLVLSALEEAKLLGIKKVFILTFIPEYFKKLGFKAISMKKLPHKVWSDCIDCVYFPNCKEEALIKDISK